MIRSPDPSEKPKMKTIFAAMFVVLSTSTAPHAFGQSPGITGQSGFTRPNVFGGQNYHTPSGKIVTSKPNVFGGQNYSNGLSSRPNAFGGKNYSNGVTSRPNAFGGYNYNNGWSSRSNAFGGKDYRNSSGEAFSTRPNAFGGTTTQRR